ncbi:unnamed protein product [Rotaria sp. Silwood2]|nr:unnamed protein product [Rotaria sp. Silwood2]
MQNKRSVTAAELQSLTNVNTTERTIQRYRLSLGYHPRKSIIKVKSNNINEQKRWLNADTYCATVKEALFGNIRKLNGFFYISDEVKCHRSPQFQQWCDRYNIELYEWPGYSPDLNAIELIWNIIKQEIKNNNPKSQCELENAVDEALDGLSMNIIQACIKKTQKIYEQFVSSY